MCWKLIASYPGPLLLAFTCRETTLTVAGYVTSESWVAKVQSLHEGCTSAYVIIVKSLDLDNWDTILLHMSRNDTPTKLYFLKTTLHISWGRIFGNTVNAYYSKNIPKLANRSVLKAVVAQEGGPGVQLYSRRGGIAQLSVTLWQNWSLWPNFT